jgi:poly(A) polymerase
VRAIEALRRAVAAAEDDEPGPPVAPTLAEWQAVPADALRAHLDRVLLGARADRGLELLREEGALGAVLEDVAALVGFGEGEKQHKDVWEHTKRVVAQSPARLPVRWAALLHDVGKVPTRRVEADGLVQFHGHAEVGARMARKVLSRLLMPDDVRRRVRLLVKLHQRPSQYEPTWTDSAVRRFGKEAAEVLDDLLDLSRADMTTKHEGKRRRGHELIDDLERRTREIRDHDAQVPPLPKGLGHGIVERFGVLPGPRIGALRGAVEAAVDRGDLEPHQEAEVYLAWLAAHLDDI